MKPKDIDLDNKEEVQKFFQEIFGLLLRRYGWINTGEFWFSINNIDNFRMLFDQAYVDARMGFEAEQHADRLTFLEMEEANKPVN